MIRLRPSTAALLAPLWYAALVVALVVGLAASCGGSDGNAAGGTARRATTSSTAPSTSTAPVATTTAPPTTAVPTTAAPTTAAPTTVAHAPTTVPPTTVAPKSSRGLAGRTILVDPGHNGGNSGHAAAINKQVFVGNAMKACDTTGTATRSGYSEAAYTLDVAQRLSALLTAAGAKAVMTRTTNTGVGPCIDQRAGLGSLVKADLAVSIHADGSSASNRGFHVIEPLPVAGYNEGIVAESKRFGGVLRDVYAAETGVPPSNYAGVNGEVRRSDLGGLNLSKVPKVFIETGNMASPTDAALLTDPAFRQKAAAAIADAMKRYFAGA